MCFGFRQPQATVLPAMNPDVLEVYRKMIFQI